MRLLSFLFLVAFTGAVVIFAMQNQQQVSVSFWKWDMSISVAAIVGAAYVLGMLSGWSVIRMIRRSLHRVEAPPREYAGSR